MKENHLSHLMYGFYLGLILAGITFIGLYVLCPPPTKNGMWLSFTDTVQQAAIEKITAEELAKGHRYLGREGIDLLWGFDPRNIYREDVKIPFGLFVLPLLGWGLTTLAYVAVLKCRQLISHSSRPDISPAP